MQSADSIERQAYGIAAHLAVRVEVRQTLLEAPNVPALLDALGQVLASEIELLRLERKIDDEVRGSLFQNQREFYLQEQLKAIHRELGQDDGDDVDRARAPDRSAQAAGARCKTRALREVRKLRRMSPLSPESTVARNFVDWIVALPWTERTDDVLDVAHARRVLDEDHYGLEEVKDRILDYIGVLSLVERHGRTDPLPRRTAGRRQDVARPLDRARARPQVRAHVARRRARRSGDPRTSPHVHRLDAGTRHPGDAPRRSRESGDPARRDRQARAATIAAIRRRRCSRCSIRSRTRAFNDHYLEVDYDLSQVLFITTANYLPQVPEPLRDRMEIIRLAGLSRPGEVRDRAAVPRAEAAAS